MRPGAVKDRAIEDRDPDLSRPLADPKGREGRSADTRFYDTGRPHTSCEEGLIRTRYIYGNQRSRVKRRGGPPLIHKKCPVRRAEQIMGTQSCRSVSSRGRGRTELL